MPDASEMHSKMQQLDDLLREAEQSADPATQSRLQTLASALLELHGMALRRVLDHIAESGENGEAILEACARDKAISPVLVLHGLHPLDLETRVREALKQSAPYVASHGGNVELLSISDEGVVSLRLEGSCHGCPSSRVTLQSTIEKEIYAAAPEVTSIDVEGLVEETPPTREVAGFVPMNIHGAPLHAIAAAS